MRKMPAHDLMVFCDHGSGLDFTLGPLIHAGAKVDVPDDVSVWPFTRAEGKMWTNAALWLPGKTLDEMDETNQRGKERTRSRGGLEYVMPDGSLYPMHTRDTRKLLDATKKVQDGGLKLIRRYNFACGGCRFDPPLNAEKVDAQFDSLIEDEIIGVSLRMLEGMVQYG